MRAEIPAIELEFPSSAQRTERWVRDRLGLVTASRFGDAMAKLDTKRYQNYKAELIDQRIGLINFNDYIERPWFKHGLEMEPRAITAFACYASTCYPDAEIISLPAFIKHPLERAGCSPDVVLMQDGRLLAGCELKCRASASTQLNAINGGIENTYRPQVQGSMWVTGLDSWFYGNYCEDMHLSPENRFHVAIVRRDDTYILRLAIAVQLLDAEVEIQAREILEALG